MMVGGVMEMGWAKQSVVCIVHRMERGRENRIGFMLHHHNCSRLFERIFENHVAAAALSLLLRCRCCCVYSKSRLENRQRSIRSHGSSPTHSHAPGEPRIENRESKASLHSLPRTPLISPGSLHFTKQRTENRAESYLSGNSMLSR